MASRLVPKFFRIGDLVLNPRYIKQIELTQTKAKIHIANTNSNGYSLSNDTYYEFHQNKNPKEYSDIFNMVNRCTEC